jgi:hypothetical protein
LRLVRCAVRVASDTLSVGHLHGPLDRLGPFDPQAGAVKVSDDVLRGAQHGGVLRATVSLPEVAAVVSDKEKGAVVGGGARYDLALS